jgi:hypothetical protein
MDQLTRKGKLADEGWRNFLVFEDRKSGNKSANELLMTEASSPHTMKRVVFVAYPCHPCHPWSNLLSTTRDAKQALSENGFPASTSEAKFFWV